MPTKAEVKTKREAAKLRREARRLVNAERQAAFEEAVNDKIAELSAPAQGD